MTNDSTATGSEWESPDAQTRLQVKSRKFVILWHDHPFLHWDFLIEDGTDLASWRLLELPQSGKRVPALLLPVHRCHYLTWEGPVSGGRGSVRRIYSGELECEVGWPNVVDWPGIRFNMVDSGFAEHCQLIHGADNQVHWEFS